MDISEEMFLTAEARSDEILARPGVTGWDVGVEEIEGRSSGEYAIRIYVADLASAQGLFPPDFDGLRVNLLEATFEDSPGPAGDTTRYDPLVAGCEIENGSLDVGSSGTLGVFLTHRERPGLFGLTCAHVVCHANFKRFDQICQPSRDRSGPPPPANVIGLLEDWNLDHDCAIFNLRVTPKREIIDIGPPAGSRVAPPVDPNNLAVVRMRGRTTMLTYGHLLGRQRLFTEVEGKRVPPYLTVKAMFPPFSGSGDSGGVLVDADNFVVGMHFSRSTPDGTYARSIPFDDIQRCFPVDVAT